MRHHNSSGSAVDRSRRSFVLLLPLAAIGGMFATIATAAFRLLRPAVSASSENWIDVALVAELSGNKPVQRKVVAEVLPLALDTAIAETAQQVRVSSIRARSPARQAGPTWPFKVVGGPCGG